MSLDRFGRRALAALLPWVAVAAACGGGQPTEAERTPGAPPGGIAELAADHAVAADKFDPVDRSPCRDGLGDSGGEGVSVYFVCEAAGPDVAAAVFRALAPGADPLTTALAALFAGPTPEEQTAGYMSGFDERTAGLAFEATLDDGLAVVNLSSDFLEVEFLFVPLADVATLVSTAGRIPGVERVLVLVDGAPLCEALGDC